MTLRSWLVSLAFSALAISSLHLWRHRDKPRPVPATDIQAEEVIPFFSVPRLTPDVAPARRPVRRPAATGMATIHGQVLGAEGPLEDTEEAEAKPTLLVSDGEDEFEAKIESDGRFTIELPPGTYRLHARLEAMTATLDAITVAAEEDETVVLQLAAGVSIKGTLRPPNDQVSNDGKDDLDEEVVVQFQIRLSGESEWSDCEEITIDGDRFTLSALEAGKSYDLSITAEGFRPVQKLGIATPSDGLFVDMVRLARLRGGFGIARGEDCPITEVIVSTDNEAETQFVLMDQFCHFEVPSLPAANRVRVQVSEEDWQFNVLVDIPPQGDPPFLCLRSLCRDPAPDELSSLEVSLTDAPDKSFRVSVLYDGFGFRAGAHVGEIAQVPDIRSGKTTMVSVFSASCRPIERTLVLRPGVNRLAVACQKW